MLPCFGVTLCLAPAVVADTVLDHRDRWAPWWKRGATIHGNGLFYTYEHGHLAKMPF